MTITAIEARALGKRFARRGNWALRDCSFRLPAGRVCALVGVNGAGKSTLLALAAGLIAPTEGGITVLGGHPADARPDLGYVAQDKPMYPQLTVAETLRMGADLNPGRWDPDTAERIVSGGALDRDARIRSLSGGQRTRVALALALAKRPRLLLLDEPMADLDPLARRELMGLLMATVAEQGTTILMSSHVMAELEDSCDHLLVIGDGRVRLAGDMEELLAAHRLLDGPAQDGTSGAGPELGQDTVVVSHTTTGRQCTALVRDAGAAPPDGWRAAEPSLEEVIVAYLRNPEVPGLALDTVFAAPQEATA
ncbi:ABC transporter ATP-binding protein [Streptomyces albus]|uniref:ABC transporter ATP-binding protein n=1 Tax=Streptomyces albus TaxID=1888 RepID=A0A8H1LCE3_9ACTN|nr:ABC transporter ATP-binding protein [Streptomyces albus]TGG80467.1 ABC transporter ATP-binding protein [Streptomyces albus]UVN54295.1 ABC transporter ATP-binding protein [Streptomyces albus]